MYFSKMRETLLGKRRVRSKSFPKTVTAALPLITDWLDLCCADSDNLNVCYGLQYHSTTTSFFYSVTGHSEKLWNQTRKSVKAESIVQVHVHNSCNCTATQIEGQIEVFSTVLRWRHLQQSSSTYANNDVSTSTQTYTEGHNNSIFDLRCSTWNKNYFTTGIAQTLRERSVWPMLFLSFTVFLRYLCINNVN